MLTSNVGNTPGFSELVQSVEWGGIYSCWNGERGLLSSLSTIGSASTDAGNTGNTTTLRPGLVMAVKTSDSKWYPYDPTQTDGRQNAAGVLPFGVPMLGIAGSVEDKVMSILTRGNIIAAQAVNLDAQAQRQLEAIGFNFDAPLKKQLIVKAADYTVVAADNGAEFQATAAVNFTLPAAAAGYEFTFTQTANANLVVTGSTNIVCDGNAGATSITYSTASHKIGSRLRLTTQYVGSAWKYVAENLGGTTMTIA
jgi:Bacteriophage lambda head decoration protein D